MGKHLYLWFLFLVFGFFLLPLVQSQEAVLDRIKGEVAQTDALFGNISARDIVRQTNRYFDAMFVQTGLAALGSKGSSSDDEVERTKSSSPLGTTMGRLADSTNNYIDALIAQGYALTLRLVLMMQWMPYVAPFVVGVVVHGLAIRKIKFDTGGMISPMVYAGGLHMMVIILLFPILYLILPIQLTPMFMPYWLVISAIPTILVLSNIQRMKK